MSEKILIIDRIEDILKDGEVAGKECFDKTGQSVKVKKGKGGGLEGRWDELLIGRAYSFTMGEFKGYPFVENFKSIESQFVQQAQERVEDTRGLSIEAQVAFKGLIELCVADKLKVNSPEIISTIAWALTRLGGKYESNIPRKTESSQDIPSIKDRGEDRQDSREASGEPGADDTGRDEDPRERIKKLYQQRGMWQEGKGWTFHLVTTHIKGITGKMDIKQLTDTELTNVESDLIAQIKIIKEE